MKDSEALEKIRELASKGRVSFASDTVASQLDPEIQEIFEVIRISLTGKKPKRPIWASDLSKIHDVLDLENRNPTERSLEAVASAEKHLGIAIDPGDTFVDVAMKLRSKRRTVEQ